MAGREEPHLNEYKRVLNDWNYDVCCTLTSLLFSDLENLMCLVVVVQSIQLRQLSVVAHQSKPRPACKVVL